MLDVRDSPNGLHPSQKSLRRSDRKVWNSVDFLQDVTIRSFEPTAEEEEHGNVGAMPWDFFLEMTKKN